MDQDVRRILDAIAEDGTITTTGAMHAAQATNPTVLRRRLAKLVGAGVLVRSTEETLRTTPLGDAVRANRQRTDYIVNSHRRLTP